MSIEENAPNGAPVENVEPSLDEFEAEFFGRNQPSPSPASEDTPSVEDDVDDAPNDDTPSDDDTVDPVDETPKAQPKKKNSAQERINEAVGKQRQAERERDALEARLAALEAKITPPAPEAKPTEQVQSKPQPSPDDKNEDGSDKYPLGEWDPAYNRDATKWAVQEELAAYKASQDQQAQELAEHEHAQAELQALSATWEAQRTAAQERYPDFQEKGVELVGTFEGIEPQYGEYLSQTIMSMDNGADVLYYLANNIDEAEAIVNMGARKATIALGRLEAKFANAGENEHRPIVSNAPAPPPSFNRGSAAARPAIAHDTDDLTAFEAEFYKKK